MTDLIHNSSPRKIGLKKKKKKNTNKKISINKESENGKIYEEFQMW